ncbi:hypothetical protein CLV59_104265 [Chitinophaga dinghuensis]|uniref:Uncharacterized protein n=1 Tax=Chitinophaga dinghuensis TaxID=1539050 RepID=A0A327W0X6_9BACT|nr:hypothetical protein [Chitinophaga dinghuensis]RAJ82040.1 hypothetical protein CLV59_104265 [Chitinophaga dinghuensis]
MIKERTTAPVYTIPLRYRKMENLHIVFWLLKDVAWCMIWKPLGIAMIFPTLIISLVIAWRTRQYVAELCHNVAISLWISANSYWMISEFFHFDAMVIYGEMTFKHLALIPFVSGILILAFYYLWYQPRHKEEESEMIEE